MDCLLLTVNFDSGRRRRRAAAVHEASPDRSHAANADDRPQKDRGIWTLFNYWTTRDRALREYKRTPNMLRRRI